MVHGYGAGIGLWAKNLEPLGREFRVIALDLLGFGRSSRPSPNFSKTELHEAQDFFTDSLERFRQTIGLEGPFTLLGHSFGGYVSALYAMQHPQLVSKLILASSLGLTHKVEGVSDIDLA